MPEGAPGDPATELIHALDDGRMLAWTSAQPVDLSEAYALALRARSLRIARGERPVGFKVGFTNRTIWPRYGVYAPIWGTVYAAGLVDAPQGQASLSLGRLAQPRIEPEIVFGLARSPASDDLQAVSDSIAWVAHGFEIVHTHFPFWKFTAAQTVADFGLHGALVIGPRVPWGVELADASTRAAELADASTRAAELAALRLELLQDGVLRDSGQGANVLDSPLHALAHFVQALRATPGAPGLGAGDVVTTGTLTDAWSVQPGQTWSTRLQAGGLAARLAPLSLTFLA